MRDVKPAQGCPEPKDLSSCEIRDERLLQSIAAGTEFIDQPIDIPKDPPPPHPGGTFML